jgi:hypothetical protein
MATRRKLRSFNKKPDAKTPQSLGANRPADENIDLNKGRQLRKRESNPSRYFDEPRRKRKRKGDDDDPALEESAEVAASKNRKKKTRSKDKAPARNLNTLATEDEASARISEAPIQQQSNNNGAPGAVPWEPLRIKFGSPITRGDLPRPEVLSPAHQRKPGEGMYQSKNPSHQWVFAKHLGSGTNGSCDLWVKRSENGEIVDVSISLLGM